MLYQLLGYIREFFVFFYLRFAFLYSPRVYLWIGISLWLFFLVFSVFFLLKKKIRLYRHDLYAALAIFILVFLIGILGARFFATPEATPYPVVAACMAGYDTYEHNQYICSVGMFGDYHEIGYTSLIAFLYMIFGTKFFLMVFVTLLFSALGFVFIYFSFRRFFGFLASIGFVVAFMLTRMNLNYLYTTTSKEPFTFFFFSLFLLLAVSLDLKRKRDYLFYFFMGLCWTMLMFVRIQFLILSICPLILIVLWNRRFSLKPALLFLLPIIVLFHYNLYMYIQKSYLTDSEFLPKVSLMFSEILKSVFNSSLIFLFIVISFFIVAFFVKPLKKPYLFVKIFLALSGLLNLLVIFLFYGVWQSMYHLYFIFAFCMFIIFALDIWRVLGKRKAVFLLFPFILVFLNIFFLFSQGHLMQGVGYSELKTNLYELNEYMSLSKGTQVFFITPNGLYWNYFYMINSQPDVVYNARPFFLSYELERGMPQEESVRDCESLVFVGEESHLAYLMKIMENRPDLEISPEKINFYFHGFAFENPGLDENLNRLKALLACNYSYSYFKLGKALQAIKLYR